MTATALLAALAAVAVGLIKRRPLAAFGILFFFAGHLIESTFLPLELAFEHRNYLPTLGLLLAMADLLLIVSGRLGRLQPIIVLAIVGILFGTGLLRSLTWGDAVQIHLTAVTHTPPSRRAQAELAQIFTEHGQIDRARAVLVAAKGPGPRLQEVYLDCLAAGRADPARFRAAMNELDNWVSDYDTTALILVANFALDERCLLPNTTLIKLLENAANASAIHVTNRQKLMLYVGHLRHAAGDGLGAEAALETAYRWFPANPIPLLLAAHWRLDAGDHVGAKALIDRARQAPVPPRLDISEQYRELEARLVATP